MFKSLAETIRANRQFKQERTKERAEAWTRHKELLDKAAGVSSVNLVCHPETWRRVSLWAFRVEISSVPVPDMEPLETVALPGPRLIKVLNELHFRMKGRNPEIQAIATRVYTGIAEVINGVEQGAADGTPIPDVMIDDKLASPTAE